MGADKAPSASAEPLKKLAAEAAMAEVRDGMRLGLGTGSTARYFVEAVARAVRDGLKLTLVSTSAATTDLAVSLGLSVLDADQVGRLDLVVDGADEIGPGLALIKGGGGALLREKLIWEMSDRCVVISDSAKQVDGLGAFALPLEIEPFAHKGTLNRITDVLVEFDIPALPRQRRMGEGVWISDGGNLIYDIACGRIDDPTGLAAALKGVTGVVDHGLFLDLADLALIGTVTGLRRLEP